MANFGYVSQFPTVPDGAARSVAAPTKGVADATVSATNWQGISLSFYQGQYIKMYCEGSDIYYFFAATAAQTPTDGVLDNVSCQDRLFLGTKEHMVVPGRHFLLRYKAVSGTGNVLRILRA